MREEQRSGGRAVALALEAAYVAASPCFEGYDGSAVVSEETTWGLRDLDPSTREVVGLEFWRASESLPGELLAMLPAPPIGVAG